MNRRRTTTAAARHHRITGAARHRRVSGPARHRRPATGARHRLVPPGASDLHIAAVARRRGLAGLLVFAIAAVVPFVSVRQAAAAVGDLSAYTGGTGTGTATSIAVTPRGLATDGANLYIADPRNDVVRKVDLASGIATQFAGVSAAGFSGDGGQATAAQLDAPYDVDVDGSGNVYIVDYGNNRIRKVTAGGVISTIAGTGTAGSTGDGAAATSATINAPQGVAVDPSGNVFISDSGGGRIRKITVGTGIISSFVTGLTTPKGIDTDASGNVYVATANRIYRYTAAGVGPTSIAGGASSGNAGDGGLATSATLSSPAGVQVDASNNVYISDTGNNRIRMVTNATGNISAYAGTGTAGYSGDSGAATSATMDTPTDVVVTGSTVYFGHYSTVVQTPYRSAVRKVAAGTITTAAGNGFQASSGDGGQAVNAQVDQPSSMTRDAAGNAYVSDSYSGRIRKITPAGVITTVAGNGIACVSACTTPASVLDGNTAVTAMLCNPTQVAVAANGDLYIADTGHNRIRKVDAATGLISTVAGTGFIGSTGDGGAATSARLSQPMGLVIATDNSLWVADTGNNKIRRIVVGGNITTVAGTGVGAFTDGDATSTARFYQPGILAWAADGALIVTDQYNNRIRRMSGTTVSTIVGTGTASTTGDYGTAVNATINRPGAVTYDAFGNLYVAEYLGGVVRRVDGNGIITTVAGNTGLSTFQPDGPATSVKLLNPSGLMVDGTGNLYVSDRFAQRVRMLQRGTVGVAQWWTSSNQTAATGVKNAWSFETAATGTVAKITAIVPAGTAGTPTVNAVSGVPAGGSVSLVGTTLTYTLASPTPIDKGVRVYLRVAGLTNTGSGGTYASTVTTLAAGDVAIDAANSNTLTLAGSNTALLPEPNRQATFGSPSTISITVTPIMAGLADRTADSTFTMGTNAPNGYTLSVAGTALTGSAGTISQATTGVATSVAAGAFPSNRVGYTVSVSGTGGPVTGLVGRYAGYTVPGETAASASAAAAGETVTVSNRVKVDYLTRPGTYTATVSCVLTPAYT